MSIPSHTLQCTSCGYDLTGLALPSLCPECGVHQTGEPASPPNPGLAPAPRWFKAMRTAWSVAMLATVVIITSVMVVAGPRAGHTEFPDRVVQVYMAECAVGFLLFALAMAFERWKTAAAVILLMIGIGILLPAFGTA